MTIFVEDAKNLREQLLQYRRWGVRDMLVDDKPSLSENVRYFDNVQAMLEIVDDIIMDEMRIMDEMGYIGPHHDPADAL